MCDGTIMELPVKTESKMQKFCFRGVEMTTKLCKMSIRQKQNLKKMKEKQLGKEQNRIRKKCFA